jgi:heme-degrading monooxygenase HmoA
VIARIWRGAIHSSDLDDYVAYVRETGVAQYVRTPGNAGAWILSRSSGELTEILTLSLWDDMEAIRKFAGDDAEKAVYYPEDDRFLVERNPKVDHFEVRDRVVGTTDR